MLNSGAKKEALERLQKAVADYEAKGESVRKGAEALFQLRQDTATSVIAACEQYLSHLANAPVELKKSVGDLKLEFNSFKSTVDDLNRQAYDAAVKAGGGAATGALAGVGVAALAPTAAMAVATTFGTASTGVAISTLSGAAATNAALAWLGGGAIAAGGSGMAGGSALLALAGPVGWAIAGAGLIGSIGYASHKNAKIAEEANDKARAVRKQILILERAEAEIVGLTSLTRQHESGVRDQLAHLRAHAPSDYLTFNADDKRRLGALVNNVRALAQLLNQKITIQEAHA